MHLVVKQLNRQVYTLEYKDLVNGHIRTIIGGNSLSIKYVHGENFVSVHFVLYLEFINFGIRDFLLIQNSF